MTSESSTKRSRRLSLMASIVLGLAAPAVPGVHAGETQAVAREDLRMIAADLEEQRQRLAAQERALADQQRVIAEQQNQLDFLRTQMGLPPSDPVVPVVYDFGSPGRSASRQPGVLRAQNSTQQPVGEAPVEQRPEVSIIPEQGGVLTRQGQLVVEPSIEYANSSTSRFFFQGFEVVDTVLIGLVEATDADRDTYQVALGTRYGVTDRLEIEARIPYVYRDDKVENTFVSVADQPSITEGGTGDGLGDIELAAHYQINNGLGGWPYFVGNLRVKSDTGTSPFEVDFDSLGIAQELATGSGFWAVQPSVTTLFPTDPAVYFGSLGYTWNIKRNVDETIPSSGGPVEIGDVDPGDSVNLTFGMGVSLNERTSFSLGFEYNYVFETEQELNGQDAELDDLKVGSLLLGWSYQLSDDIGLNLNTAVGVTDDATDFRTTLRVPIRFDLF